MNTAKAITASQTSSPAPVAVSSLAPAIISTIAPERADEHRPLALGEPEVGEPVLAIELVAGGADQGEEGERDQRQDPVGRVATAGDDGDDQRQQRR